MIEINLKLESWRKGDIEKNMIYYKQHYFTVVMLRRLEKNVLKRCS